MLAIVNIDVYDVWKLVIEENMNMKYYDFDWIEDATRYCFGSFWSDTVDPEGRWCYWCEYNKEWRTSSWVEEDFARFGGGVWRHEDKIEEGAECDG